MWRDPWVTTTSLMSYLHYCWAVCFKHCYPSAWTNHCLCEVRRKFSQPVWQSCHNNQSVKSVVPLLTCVPCTREQWVWAFAFVCKWHQALQALHNHCCGCIHMLPWSVQHGNLGMLPKINTQAWQWVLICWEECARPLSIPGTIMYSMDAGRNVNDNKQKVECTCSVVANNETAHMSYYYSA